MRLFLVDATLTADHSWGSYHWGRTSNPFTLKVGDNVDSNWDSYLSEAIAALLLQQCCGA